MIRIKILIFLITYLAFVDKLAMKEMLMLNVISMAFLKFKIVIVDNQPVWSLHLYRICYRSMAAAWTDIEKWHAWL
jgi:hypothetical protein